jgi:hypothetical protein
MRHLLGVEAVVGFVQMAILTVFYGLRSNWRASLAGLVLMSSFMTKLVIFAMIGWGMFQGPLGPGVWAVAVGVFDIVQAGWLVLLVRQQQKERVDAPVSERNPLP